jgi:hypothetical protein
MAFEHGFQVGRGGLAGQSVEMERQLHEHALREVADRGNEDGAAHQACVLHDFRQMLVLQPQGIDLVGRGAARSVGLDHGAPAARVAAHRGEYHRVIGRERAGIHQRTQQCNGARGIAPRIAHALCPGNGFTLARGQFRKAEHPAIGGSVRGRCVDDAGLPCASLTDLFHHRCRLARGFVVQAEDDQVDSRHQLAFGRGILALFRRDAHELDLRHLLEPLADLQAGGASLAIDENLGHLFSYSNCLSLL